MKVSLSNKTFKKTTEAAQRFFFPLHWTHIGIACSAISLQTVCFIRFTLLAFQIVGEIVPHLGRKLIRFNRRLIEAPIATVENSFYRPWKHEQPKQ